MAAFASPVRRGDFLYSSVLYADAGNGNHHPRASVAELAALLRPESRSKSSQPVTPAKDQVGHWYTAQLLHYGLASIKDKNAAKVRLLNALNQFTLEVPAWILKVESELKKEWEAENRKLKRGSKAASGGSSTQAPYKGVNFSVNVSVSAGLSMVEQLGLTQSTNTASSQPKTSTGKRKRDNAVDAKPRSTPTKTATPTKTKSNLGTGKKQTARKSASVTAPYSPLHPDQTPLPSGPPRAKKPRVKQEPGYQESTPTLSPIKQESRHRTLPSVSPNIKREPRNNNNTSDTDLILSGTYKVTCPLATQTFPSLDPRSLRLALSLDEQRGVWWATFSWWSWEVFIQMNPGPSYETLGQPCSLGWRMRNLETGELKFGRGCTGQMTFSRDQTIRAVLYEVPYVGDVEFWGPRMKRSQAARSGDEFQEEWDGFTKEAYGR